MDKNILKLMYTITSCLEIKIFMIFFLILNALWTWPLSSNLTVTTSQQDTYAL